MAELGAGNGFTSACSSHVPRSDPKTWRNGAGPLASLPDVEVVSSSPQETEAVGAALAAVLAPGDVVTVAGDLGAGKTTLIRGACRALGVTDAVTSPTFTIGHRYHGTADVSHLDLYRFAAVSDEEWGDLEPYFENAIAFVEWPEAGAGALPPARVRVQLRHDAPSRRLISLDGDRELLERAFADAGARV
jgi:tRNA threonylcarbamoyladenosine biosynthesis protein TsaE